MAGPPLRTARLVLRAWREEDLAPLAALSADPQVMDWLMGPIDRAASDAIAARQQTRLAEDGFCFWAIEAPGVADFIGLAGLARVWAEAPFAPAVEIAWRLARPYWGQGYATEAAQAALADGFERLGFDEVVAVTGRANRRSLAVMERLGMRRDEAGDFEHPRLPEGHRLRPHVLCRLPREIWMAGQRI